MSNDTPQLFPSHNTPILLPCLGRCQMGTGKNCGGWICLKHLVSLGDQHCFIIRSQCGTCLATIIELFFQSKEELIQCFFDASTSLCKWWASMMNVDGADRFTRRDQFLVRILLSILRSFLQASCIGPCDCTSHNAVWSMLWYLWLWCLKVNHLWRGIEQVSLKGSTNINLEQVCGQPTQRQADWNHCECHCLVDAASPCSYLFHSAMDPSSASLGNLQWPSS